MALNLEGKKAIVAEVNAVASESLAAVAADYQGLTVLEMNELRTKARAAGVYMRIVRNTLARRAFEGTSFACMSDSLVGPLVLAFSKEEPGAAARLIRDFAKQHDTLEVKSLSIDGQVFDASHLASMASLPNLQEARGMLLGLLQAPASQLVRTLAEPQAKFVRLLAAQRDAQGAE